MSQEPTSTLRCRRSTDCVSFSRKPSTSEQERAYGPCTSTLLPFVSTSPLLTRTRSDFADQYPSASVIGTDIAPTQPSWVPPNLELYASLPSFWLISFPLTRPSQIDDCTVPWTFSPNSLDYIHMRWLIGAVQDWPALYAQAFAALKPGGWLESYEPASTFESDDGTVTDDCAVMQWTKIFIEGGKKLGRSFTIYEDGVQKTAMEEVGFVGVDTRELKVCFVLFSLRNGADHDQMTVPGRNMAHGPCAARGRRVHAAGV